MFGQYFAADVLQRLRSRILIEMLKLGLVNILNSKFSRDGDVWLNSTHGSVVPLAMFFTNIGLEQCF